MKLRYGVWGIEYGVQDMEYGYGVWSTSVCAHAGNLE